MGCLVGHMWSWVRQCVNTGDVVLETVAFPHHRRGGFRRGLPSERLTMVHIGK